MDAGGFELGEVTTIVVKHKQKDTKKSVLHVVFIRGQRMCSPSLELAFAICGGGHAHAHLCEDAT